MIQNLPPSIDPKIVGRRLQEMRKTKGLTQKAVADLIGVSRTTVTAVEKGQRQFHPSEIIRLCESWKISVSDFVRQREVVENFVPQLRALAAQSGSNWEIEAAIEECRQLSENYLELEDLCHSHLQSNDPPTYLIKGIPIEQAAEDIAIKERNRLGLGDGPILNLREVLETDVSLRVFYLKGMPGRVSGMYFPHQKLGRCIAINTNHPEARRRWSLAHEYAHFLVDRFQADVSFLYAYKRIPREERFADAFAQYFLMPTARIKRHFYELKQANNGKITAADLCTLAHRYDVSFEALLLRLEGLRRLIPVGTLERLKDSGFKVHEAQELLGLTPPAPYDHRLPLRYQYLAVVAFERGYLSEGQFAHMMGVDRVEARQIAESFGRTLSVSEDGVIGDRLINLTEIIVDDAQRHGS